MITETITNRDEMTRALRDVAEGDRVEFDTVGELSVASEVQHVTDEYIVVGSAMGSPLAVDIERARAHKWSDQSEDPLTQSPAMSLERLKVTIDPKGRNRVDKETKLYIVECDECGQVEFKERRRGDGRFGSDLSAAYYAGYHDASEHADSERMTRALGKNCYK